MSTDLIDRIERLEKQNRWLKRGMVALVATVGACVVMAADAPKAKIVDAEKFVLRDNDGRTRAVLEIGTHGPRLALLSKDGNDQAVLYVNKDESPGLVLVGPKRDKMIALAETEEEQALLFQQRGAKRLVLATDKAGEALLTFRDGRDKVRTILSGYPADPGLIVNDRGGQNRVRLILEKGEARLELRDEKGKLLLRDAWVIDEWSQPAPPMK
jgi:hypothetical protein